MQVMEILWDQLDQCGIVGSILDMNCHLTSEQGDIEVASVKTSQLNIKTKAGDVKCKGAIQVEYYPIMKYAWDETC